MIEDRYAPQQPTWHGLSADTSDDVLRKALDDDQHLLASAQREATAAYEAAHKLDRTLQWRVDQEWIELRRQVSCAAAIGAGANHRSAADWESRLTQLRIALRAVQHFRAMTRLSPDEIAALKTQAAHDRRLAENAQAVAAMAARHPAVVTWSPADFLGRMGKRGITLALGAKGALIARPGTLMTAPELEEMRDHKLELVRLLSDGEAVA